MERYNPTGKTVVTKIESFVVDTVRKIAAHRFDVAAKADDSAIQTLDVNIKDVAYTVPDFTKHVVITCVDPVDIELVQREKIETVPVVYYSGTLSTSNSIQPGKEVSIVLADLDLVADTVTVVATNSRSNEVETVVLNKHTPDLTYVGKLATSVDPAVATTSGTMHVQPADTIAFTYEDATANNGQPVTVNASTTVDPVADQTGVITIDTGFAPGSTLGLQVFDPNEQLSLTLVVVNNRTNETETVTLNETTIGSGIFRGQLNTIDDVAAGTDYDNVLNTAQSDVLVVTYNDLRDQTGAPQSVQKSMTVGQTVTAAGSITAFTARAGASVTVEVSDVDRQGTLNVSVVNRTTGEIETVVLTETYVNSRRFVGALPTRRAEDNELWYKGQDNDGTIDVKASDVLDIVYNDPQGNSGQPIAIPTSVTITEPQKLPDPPAPIITYNTHTIRMTGKLFMFNGSAESMSIRLSKPSTDTREAIRCELTIV